MRLNKFIARSTGISRRKADEEIFAGSVRINDHVIDHPSYTVEEKDEVKFHDRVVFLPEKQIIIALYKPPGVVTTRADLHAKKTVFDLLPEEMKGLHPIGRLDKDSEGLLLFTNDGNLSYKLTHPSFGHEKEYVIETEDVIEDRDLTALSRGVLLDEGHTGPVAVKRLSDRSFSLILRQGWKRQIRRMVASCGHRVRVLKRIRIEKLRLGKLQEGTFQHVTIEDIF